jgi:hypothetical protein
LLLAATRHIRFDFEQIAEFYAHADIDLQQLMEEEFGKQLFQFNYHLMMLNF